MKVSYHGHATVKIVTGGNEILIDPFITGNELSDLSVENEAPDYILLTHGHADHLGDTVELARKKDALVIGMVELANYLSFKGLKTHGLNIGGAYDFPFGKVKLTKAFHSTGFIEEDNQIVYLGMPAGLLLFIEGKTIYHAGDTGLFSDMKLIGERHPIDLAFLPIGDNFTMGPEDAAYSAKLLQAKTVVPIHYNTFPLIKQDPEAFVARLDEGVGKVMKPGDVIEL